MINKKEKILSAALELFANEGYAATSTSKISKLAGVSEGLIFRHFNNKKRLLDAIMTDVQERIDQLFSNVFVDDDPKLIIHRTIELPFLVPREAYNYWRLQFKLKWEPDYNNPDKMQPVINKLSKAFKTLEYKQPDMEAELLYQILNAVSTDILQDNLKNKNVYKTFLLKRYNTKN